MWLVVALAASYLLTATQAPNRPAKNVDANLLYATQWFIIAYILTRLWRMSFPELSIGYGFIDIFLAAVFLQRMYETSAGIVLFPLIIIKALFVGVHISGLGFDLSGVYFGREVPEAIVEGWLRNRLFELENGYIIAVCAFRIFFVRFKWQKIITSRQRF